MSVTRLCQPPGRKGARGSTVRGTPCSHSWITNKTSTEACHKCQCHLRTCTELYSLGYYALEKCQSVWSSSIANADSFGMREVNIKILTIFDAVHSLFFQVKWVKVSLQCLLGCFDFLEYKFFSRQYTYLSPVDKDFQSDKVQVTIKLLTIGRQEERDKNIYMSANNHPICTHNSDKAIFLLYSFYIITTPF